MELILIIIVYIVFIFVKNYIETGRKPSDILDDINKAAIVANHSIDKQKNKSVLDEAYERTIYEQKTLNNYYTQNNVYLKQNYNKKTNSDEENKDHSEKVWKRLGYRIKKGESYSYKFYGNEIYTPDQVERIGSYSVKYSAEGLAKKLLKDTDSFEHTKNILIKDYGLNESEAKKSIPYNKFRDL